MMLIPLALFHDVLDLDLTYSDIRVLRDLIRVLDIGILNGAGPDRKMRIWPWSVNADLAPIGKYDFRAALSQSKLNLTL